MTIHRDHRLYVTDTPASPEQTGARLTTLEVQRALIELATGPYPHPEFSCAPEGADGEWGPHTATSLACFQAVFGLPATGEPDAETIALLSAVTMIEAH